MPHNKQDDKWLIVTAENNYNWLDNENHAVKSSLEGELLNDNDDDWWILAAAEV